MNAKLDLKEQCENMKLMLENVDKENLFETMIDLSEKAQFSRGYIESPVDEDLLEKSKKLLDLKNKYESESKNLTQENSKKKKHLEELVKPKIFGKSRYENNKLSITREIEENDEKLKKLELDIGGMKKDTDAAKNIIDKYNDYLDYSENQYVDDENKYYKFKSDLISALFNDLIDSPDFHISSEWNDIPDSVKDFFRLDPVKNIFPLIGWSHAFQICCKFLKEETIWDECTDQIIVSGSALSIKNKIDEMMWMYATNDKDRDDNPFHHMIKANAVLRKLYTYENVGFIFKLKEMLDEENAVIAANTIFKGNEDQIGDLFSWLFESLDLSVDLSIKCSNEGALNASTIFKNHIDENLGWLRPALVK